ncbi:MAG: hypothetical protein AABY53_02625 [Bdellovibrionota bacterium]
MRCNFIFYLIVLLFALNAVALLDFPTGNFVLEGKIVVKKTDVYLAINHKSTSESQIKLSGTVPKELLSQHGSNAAIKIKITKPFMSNLGEAEFMELKKYLDPFTIPAKYDDDKALPQN